MILKLTAALILSGLLGIERERRGRAAGLRTHVLVCLGTTMAMITSDLLATEWVAMDTNVWLDKGRIAAGILTGIGFLGAGTIINEGSIHRGLTTAAMIWFVAALGIAVGSGYFALASIATAFALFVVLALERLAISVPSQRQFTVNMRLPREMEEIDAIEQAIEDDGYRVLSSRIRIDENQDYIELSFTVQTRKKSKIDSLIHLINKEFSDAGRVRIKG